MTLFEPSNDEIVPWSYEVHGIHAFKAAYNVSVRPKKDPTRKYIRGPKILLPVTVTTP